MPYGVGGEGGQNNYISYYINNGVIFTTMNVYECKLILVLL